jgi:hypothetical protein
MPGKDVKMPTWEMSAADADGRVEISDLSDLRKFDLHLSEDVINQIRLIEESVVTAERRVGLFRVG